MPETNSFTPNPPFPPLFYFILPILNLKHKEKEAPHGTAQINVPGKHMHEWLVSSQTRKNAMNTTEKKSAKPSLVPIKANGKTSLMSLRA